MTHRTVICATLFLLFWALLACSHVTENDAPPTPSIEVAAAQTLVPTRPDTGRPVADTQVSTAQAGYSAQQPDDATPQAAYFVTTTEEQRAAE